MSPQILCLTQLTLGYIPWLLCFSLYIWPRLKVMERFDAQRAIAALHSFRFFGLAFLIPGIVGTALPAEFAAFAAYANFATGVLAMLALLTARIRALFWPLVIAFNLVGIGDIAVDFYHAVHVNLPAAAGQLGAMYGFVILYVPLQMITHIAAFYLLAGSRPSGVRSSAGDAPIS
ncbi:MAG: hypothetical protein JF628_05120 [Sphingomonas sp.]|nr:hypothetical protein [Sphingomonas sp.]